MFVESYGEVAVKGSADLARVSTSTSTRATSRLRAAGFSTRSALLTSPTFGGTSWLAHSTLQSGLWVDSQQRYDQLVATDRLTLSGAFKRAGWRTVVDVPSNTVGLARGARRSTTTTRSTTPGTSATADRGSATPRCPTSTPSGVRGTAS